MTTNSSKQQTFTLDGADEVLLDTSIAIEPTPNDMRLIEVRYRRLKDVLESSNSCIASLMTDGHCLIYPQGSVSTSTLVISGDQDDRCDVDAIVELDVPDDWTIEQVLDQLFYSLDGFPDATEVVRCTRCIQIQFPTMHMDVTPIDKRARISPERAGEIFHSPDAGLSYRLPANPAGFTTWFRGGTAPGAAFQKRASELWGGQADYRLAKGSTAEIALEAKAAEQVDIPQMIPSRLDSIEVVALKLTKRFLIEHYRVSDLKKPPSVWITKLAGDLGVRSESLTSQLYSLVTYIRSKAEHALRTGMGPDERNPSYYPDRLNDRWPQAGSARKQDLEACIKAMDQFASELEKLARAPLAEQKIIIDQLFGAKVGTRLSQILRERYQRTASDATPQIETGSGQIYAPALAPPRPRVMPIKQHHFHCGLAPKLKGPSQ
jgi:hypothetical protein